jgi:C4-dicarboxylate transporter DctQ subunit
MSINIIQHPAAVAGDLDPSIYGRWLGTCTDGICAIAAAGTVIVVLAQVAGRLLGTPVSWSEELTRAFFIWMIFIGLASSMRHADTARVTIFLQAMPRALRRVALPIYLLSSLGFFAVMGWTGAAMVRQQFAMNETIATLGCPTWILGLVMPVSAVLAILCTLESLRKHRAAIDLMSDDAREKAAS